MKIYREKSTQQHAGMGKDTRERKFPPILLEIGAKIPYLTNSSKAVTVGGPEERVHLQLLIVLLEEN